MTNHQSNIIFYTVISLIVTAIIIHVTNPDFFGDIGKSRDELLLKEAVAEGNHNKALKYYQKLIDARKNNGNEITAETAAMYEDMAQLHSAIGNTTEKRNHYLYSLKIKEQLPKNDVFAFANTYYQLGVMAEEQQQYDQALRYFEQALSWRIGDTTEAEEQDDGFTTSMHKSRLKHMRLNNEGTIATFKKLAAMHIIKNENAIAKSYYERALAASKTTFGEDDNKTLEIVNLLNQLEL
ncbi:hypothetical protein AB833_23135 [Chromatiales bacterium (ex Bugula neritina AB1)]|nr:hypothetical protein AB833_23135 [Chromatiales bacterium (ex Bugula neritina AB1)]